jgi:hypothetical protein
LSQASALVLPERVDAAAHQLAVQVGLARHIPPSPARPHSTQRTTLTRSGR